MAKLACEECRLESTHVLNFWFGLITDKEKKLSVTLYKMSRLKHEDPNSDFESRWIGKLKLILYELELGYMWVGQDNLNLTKYQFRNVVDRAIEATETKWWQNELMVNEKCSFYRLYKDKPGSELYLRCMDYKFIVSLARFRSRSNSLPVVQHLRNGESISTMRSCTFCKGDIGDEFHYLMKCPKFQCEREKFIPLEYRQRPNILRIRALMTCEQIGLLKSLAKFSEVIMSSLSIFFTVPFGIFVFNINLCSHNFGGLLMLY